MSNAAPPLVQGPHRFTVSAAEAGHIAQFIGRALAAGLDGDAVIEAVADQFPDISLRSFAGGLALYRAMRGEDGFALVFPGDGRAQ